MNLKLVRTQFSAMSAPPRRKANKDVRTREYLTMDEFKAIRAAAGKVGRQGFRDSLVVSTLFRHGLRVSELVALTWEQIHFDRSCTMLVQRVKNGTPSTHTLTGDEIRQLKQLKRSSEASRFVFCSERGGPLSQRAIHRIVQRAGEEAGLPFSVHPHMLRHSKGHQLAQRGEDTRAIQAFLGHRRIESTTVYTALEPSRFRTFGEE